MIQRIADEIHEWRISMALNRLLRFPTGANAARYNHLLRSRSPAQVDRMERDKGLV